MQLANDPRFKWMIILPYFKYGRKIMISNDILFKKRLSLDTDLLLSF